MSFFLDDIEALNLYSPRGSKRYRDSAGWVVADDGLFVAVVSRFRNAPPAIAMPPVEAEIKVLAVSTQLLLIDLVEHGAQLWVTSGQLETADGRAPKRGWRGRATVSGRVLHEAGLTTRLAAVKPVGAARSAMATG